MGTPQAPGQELPGQNVPRHNVTFRASRRSVLLALLGVFAALTATAISAVVLSSALAVAPRLAAGDSAELGALRFTAGEISRTTTLRDESGQPVSAPEGTEAVVVRYQVEMVEPIVPEFFCQVELTDGTRRWPTDTLWLGLADLDAARTCTGSAGEPLTPDQPVQVAVAFVVPEDTGPVSAELSIDELGEVHFVE